MKLKFLFIAIFLIASLSISAQKNESKLILSTENETIISFDLATYTFNDVQTSKGTAKTISAPNTIPVLKKGVPDLPKFSSSLIIPDNSLMKVKIISYEYTDIKNIEIAPSKGNISRQTKPENIPFEYGKAYNENKFFPENIAVLNDPYIMRDVRGQAVQITPFQYNPVTKTLRVYSNVKVKVYAQGIGGKNIFNRTKNTTSTSKEYNKIYKRQFINYQTISKYTSLEEEGNMLIISYDDFMPEMQALALWKNTIGRPTELVALSEIGTTAAQIKTFVTEYYNTHGLTYLLLVGDAAQIPTNSGASLGGDSDNAYAYITGNDHYLEFFVGRFSAQNNADVETQVTRTINYEKGILTNGWLNRTMAVGSDQGPGDDNEMDYEHLRNIQNDLINYTYTTPTLEFFDGNQGGNDGSGSPTPTQVGNAINSGVGIITYTGHGSDLSWSSSGFSASNVNSLTNNGMLPFVISVACVNGNFVDNNECFAEAWLRADNGGEATGAIAFLGSTINQSWAPPMAAQDEMIDILVESYANNIKRTVGGISFNGMFLMNDETSDFAMTDTWTCFGDPSVYLRTDNPQNMTVTHSSEMIFGSSVFNVNCNYDGAFACISRNGEIIGTETVSGGSANIPVEGLAPGDILTLAIVGFNKVTYISEAITVISPTGAYIVLDDYNINGLKSLNFGQTGSIELILKNVGPDQAMGVTASMTSSDPYVSTITNNESISFGNIDGNNGTSTVTGLFRITLSNEIPDGHLISFNLTINNSAKETWTSTINITANSPVFNSELSLLNDNSSEVAFTSSPITQTMLQEAYQYNIVVEGNAGNGNNLLDPGETANLTLNIENSGSANLTNAVCYLTSTSEYVTINTSNIALETFDAGETTEATFNISVDEATPVSEIIELILHVEGDLFSTQKSVFVKVGLIIEGFESGDFSAFNWIQGGSANWSCTATAPYTGSYSAVSGNTNDNQTSELSLTIDVLFNDYISFYSKVSSEENYDFLSFYIDGTEIASWSGVTSWEESTFPISAGTHTIKWSFVKDASVSTGSDCGWVDNIIFPGIATKKSTQATTISANVIPAWLSLTDYGDGTGILQGTTPAEISVHNVVLQAQADGPAVNQEFTIAVGTVSIEKLAKNFNIYPNPTSGKLYINKEDNTINKVEITNISGQIIYSSIICEKTNFIDKSELTSGIYFINIYSENKKISKKLIVK